MTLRSQFLFVFWRPLGMLSIVNPAPSLRHAFPLYTLFELPWQFYRESSFWKVKERKRTVLFTIFYLANGLPSDRYTIIMGCQTFPDIALSSYSMHLVQAIDQIPFGRSFHVDLSDSQDLQLCMWHDTSLVPICKQLKLYALILSNAKRKKILFCPYHPL
jgi:hypothetical protein